MFRTSGGRAGAVRGTPPLRETSPGRVHCLVFLIAAGARRRRSRPSPPKKTALPARRGRRCGEGRLRKFTAPGGARHGRRGALACWRERAPPSHGWSHGCDGPPPPDGVCGCAVALPLHAVVWWYLFFIPALPLTTAAAAGDALAGASGIRRRGRVRRGRPRGRRGGASLPVAWGGGRRTGGSLSFPAAPPLPSPPLLLTAHLAGLWHGAMPRRADSRCVGWMEEGGGGGFVVAQGTVGGGVGAD